MFSCEVSLFGLIFDWGGGLWGWDRMAAFLISKLKPRVPSFSPSGCLVPGVV